MGALIGGRAASSALRRLERRVVRERTVSHPQLWITGLPRSGTTLVSQALFHRLDLVGFTRGAGLHPKAPAVATWIDRRTHRGYRSDFESEYGRSRGAVAPREAGAVWGRWFGFHDYVEDVPVGAQKQALAKATVTSLQAWFDRPFANKNVKHLLRLPLLLDLFPSSRFVVVDRDLEDVAISLFRAQRRSFDAGGPWISIKPPETTGESLAEQTASQVHWIKKRMENDLSRLPEGRVLRLDYATFCADPESGIDAVADLLTDDGTAPRRNRPLSRFSIRGNAAKTDDEEHVLASLRRLRSNDGALSP